MQNIDVRFNATSNFTKVRGDIAALQAQAASLNAVFEKGAYAKKPAIVDHTAWAEGTAAVNRASRVYRDAASSSGLLTTQQITATSEAEKYTKALQKQKLSLGEMIKHQGIMKEVYRDQLRYQRMSAHYWGTDQMGRAVTDIAIPKSVPADLDTMRRRMGMFGNMAASAGTQVVNLGKNIQWSGRQLTVGLTYPMMMLGAAAGVMAYKVEDAFGAINKVYDVSADAQTNEALRTKELGNLRVKSMEMATKAAQDYGVTIQSTLDIEQALAATGLTLTTGLLETTMEVQRISRLGDIDAKQTTDMVVALGTAFKMQGKDMTDTLNYMNAASNATSLSLQDIAEATPRAASSMAALGVSAKEMTVLLVSMREAGVDAAQGANALKSATGTILAPSPAALKFVEQVAGGKIAKGFENIGKTSGGNLYKAMQQMYELTSGLSKLERQQVLVKLFGKYQFNRVSAMLDNLGSAFDGTQNQARAAMDMMGASAKENAKMAANSLDAMTENAAGRFKAAFAAIQVELAELGKPFLTFAAKFLEGVTKVVQGFNKMDDWKKHAALIVAGALALAGPLIMTAGLMMNLTGQFIKGIGAIAKFTSWIGPAAGRFQLLTKEEQAAALSTEAQNKALQAQTAATTNLVTETQVLVAAMEKAQQSVVARLEAEGMLTREMTEEGAVAGKVAGQVVEAESMKQQAVLRTAEMVQATNEKMFAASQAAAQRGIFGQVSPLAVPAGPRLTEQSTLTTGFRGESLMQREGAAALAARQAAADAEVAALNRSNELRAVGVNKTNAQLAIQEKVKTSVNGTNLAMGAMGLSMAAMMISSNSVVQNIAKWAMIGTIAVPALKGALVAVGGIGSGMMDVVRQARLANSGMVGMAGTMGVARASAVGFGRALNAALGPVGWVILGLTAVTGVFMAINAHQKKIKEEQEAILKKQIDANKALQSSTESIATSMGKAAGAYQQIIDVGGRASAGRGDQSQILKRYNFYKSEEGNKEATALDLTDDERLMDQVREKFINLQVIGSDTAKQAKIDIQAVMMAAGTGSVKAAEMAESVYRKYGKISELDWTRPLQDQADAMNNIVEQSGGLLNTKTVDTGSIYGASKIFELNPATIALIEDQASRSAQIFEQALSSAANPNAEKKVIEQYMRIALQEWDKGWAEITNGDGFGFDQMNAKIKEFGITSGKELADAWANNPEFKKAMQGLLANPAYSAAKVAFSEATIAGAAWEKAVIHQAAENSGTLASSIDTVTGAMRGYTDAAIGLTAAQEVNNILTQNEAYKKHAAIQERINELKRHGVPDDSKEMLDLQNKLNDSGKRLTRQINELNQAYGFKQGKNATEAMNNLMHHTKEEAKGATKETDKLDKSLHDLPGRVDININVKQAVGVIKDSMAAVQDDMATSAMDKFNSTWDATMASAQHTWDNRASNLEAAQQNAQASLERHQQAAQQAFENRWQKRKDAVNNAYQSQIDGNQRAIDAETKADETRQRLFEKEKARLSRLAELANGNIDFNTALTEGRLDEAAKIQNNLSAKTASDQMDAEARAAEARTATKIAILEKKNKRLENERDHELKQLEKMEDRQKRHLERMQEARSKALEKAQAQESKALESRDAAAMDSLEKQRDYDDAMLQERLELFKSYTARNQRDLEKWMKEVGLSYDDFGSDVKAKGESWSKYFKKSLTSHIRQAGTEIMNDNIWTKVGKEMGNKLVKGLGFTDMSDFRHFVKTGEMGGGKKKGGDTETRHTGGEIGSGGGSRGNIPNSYKGLHRSEKMVRAQVGEFMVNRKDAQRNRPLLDAINSGAVMDPTARGIMGGYTSLGGGAGAFSLSGGPGMAGLMASAIGGGLKTGASKALQNVYNTAYEKYASVFSGGLFSGMAGKYGQRSFNAEQMKNAATIASVGSGMGMSKRDIEIGIMTAITESGLVNIHGGDRDSQGLFQQRPSQGWGSVAQVTNPKYAASKFFSVLKGVDDREAMSPWMAAQSVQRSAYSDGSNYQQYWDEAMGIFTKGLKKGQNGNYAAIGGGYVAGAGGRHRPINASTSGRIHGGDTGYPAVDFPAKTGSPVYAVADGTISRSYDIRGYEPRNAVQNGYRSYGRVEYLQTDAGPEVLYAHLSRRSAEAGQRVRGGSVIGYSGNTGHSTGPHLHFGSQGASPMAWLRKGGEVKWDNTPAMLHQGETVLTKSLTHDFKENVASGGGDSYTVTVDLRGAFIKEDVDIEKAINIAIDRRESKLGRRRVVR